MSHARHLVSSALAYLALCVAPLLASSIVVSNGTVTIDGHQMVPGSDCSCDKPEVVATQPVLSDSARLAGIRHEADSIGALPLLGPRSAWALMGLAYRVTRNSNLSDDPRLNGANGENHSAMYLRDVWDARSNYRWSSEVSWGVSQNTTTNLDAMGSSLLANVEELNGGNETTWRGLARLLSRVGLPGGPTEEERKYAKQDYAMSNWFKVDSSKLAVSASEASYLDAKLGPGVTGTRLGKSIVYVYALSRLDKLNGENGHFTLGLLAGAYSPLFLLFSFYALRKSHAYSNDGRGKKWAFIGYALMSFSLLIILAIAVELTISVFR